MTEATKHIALVCPGGPISRDIAEKAGEIAAAAYGDRAKLYFHPQCFETAGHFAGDDARRSAAFLEVANDPAFDALWFARGGYGAGRLEDALYGGLNDAARAKTYLGYSDTGVILARLYAMKIGRPVHGPMPSELIGPDGAEGLRRALSFLVDGDAATLEPSARAGRPVVAFNITVLAHIVAADWFPDLAGHVVLLEDLGEYLYRIDRAMGTIMGARALQNVAGVKLGRVSDVPENDRPFGADAEEIAQYWCTRVGVPYLGRADVGHDGANKVVPFGLAAG
ncbi:MAG: LD-carboxypeptidase [Pseudomonadota bacterium]